AVRTGDRNALTQAHQLRKHQRARYDRDPVGARRPDLRVVRFDRRRYDDSIGPLNVLWRMATSDLSAEFAQASGRRTLAEVRSADLVSQREQHLGDPAHPGAADADEVNALDLVFHRNVSCRGVI